MAASDAALGAGAGAVIDAHLADLRTVGGDALVRRVLGRFEQQLAEADAEGGAAWTRAFAHRTAGIAGMMGFARLAAAARAIEVAVEDRGEAAAAETAEAVAATTAALADVRRRLSPQI